MVFIRGAYVIMDIRLDLYRIFKVVVEKKNISAAAAELFISQPAVSQAIKQLENAVGLPLFRRTPKGVSATAEGQLLYEYALPALNLIKAGEQKLSAVKNLEGGELRIGASDTISRYLLLNRLEKFGGLHPGVKLKIVNRTSLEAIVLLKEGIVDLAFVNLPIADTALELREFFAVQDIFVGSQKYTGKTYSVKELSALPLILLEKKANSRLYVEDFFLQNSAPISPEIELGSHDLLLEFARIQLGVSCVIREFSEEYIKEGVLFELDCEIKIPPRYIGVAWLKGVSLSAAAQEFMAL